jgi:hypothetical protein
LCAGDCVVLKAFNANEPGNSPLKYYAPGIGNFLEVTATGAVQMTACNMDPRCASLPQP